MFVASKFWFLVCLSLFCSCTASPDCLDNGNARCQAVADSDEVGLLQQAVALTTSQKSVANLRSTPPHENAGLLDSKMSKQQILAELQLAKKARQSWETHIAALELLLSTSLHSEGDSHRNASSTSDFTWHLQMIVLFVVWCVVLCFSVLSTMKYEKERGESDLPWYHHSPTMTKVVGCMFLLWFIGGTFMFTGFMYFDGLRHLTLIESLYLSVQTVTTVGYGDIVPSTDNGLFFMAFYAIFGCSIGATLVGEIVSMYLAWQEKHLHGATKTFWNPHKGLLAQILCVAFGTIWYGTMPGENKTYIESFYMSIVTLATIGFGKYTSLTPLSQLVGSIWMLVGWIAFAQAITDISSKVFAHRQRFKSKALAVGYFKEITQERGNRMSKAEFLTFEMLRCGLNESQINEANAKFHELDADDDKSLDISEFQTYVDELFPDGK